MEGIRAKSSLAKAEAISATWALSLRNQQLALLRKTMQDISAAQLVPLIEAQRQMGSFYKSTFDRLRVTQSLLSSLHLAANIPIVRLAERAPFALERLSEQIVTEAQETGDADKIETASVVVAGAAIGTQIIQDTTITVVRALAPGELTGHAGLADLPPINIPNLIAGEIQQIIESNPGQVQNPQLFAESRVIALTRALGEIAWAVVRCNRLWPEEGKPFKYTDTSVECLLCLPQYWKVTRDGFCSIIRSLHMVLYEGAGADNLRFREADLMTDAECQVVFDIKKFRNLYCEHDLEHGKPSAIRRKKADFGTLCQRYIGVPIPRTPDHFGKIMIELIQGVRQFLDLLAQRLEER